MDRSEGDVRANQRIKVNHRTEGVFCHCYVDQYISALSYCEEPEAWDALQKNILREKLWLINYLMQYFLKEMSKGIAICT